MTGSSDLRHWVPAAAVATWIAATSVAPPAVLAATLALLPLGGGAPGGGGSLLALVPWDKVGHVVLYGVFAAALLLGTRRDRRFDRPAAAALAVAVLFGAGVELVQSQLPWRSFEVLDGAANAVGAVAGLAVVAAAGRLRRSSAAVHGERGEGPR